MSQNLSSAAVVIGVLRVKMVAALYLQTVIILSQVLGKQARVRLKPVTPLKQVEHSTDLPKALKRDSIYNMICCSRKKGFGHLFTFIIKALSCT